MVMPRSRSISMVSSTWSTISRSEMVPVSWIRRSARVDLPWSICATIEKFRILSMAVAVMARGIAFAFLSGKRAAMSLALPGTVPKEASLLLTIPDRAARARGRSLRRNAAFGQERRELDALAGGGDERIAGRHLGPLRALGIERLGDHHDIAAGFPVIERVGAVIGGVAEGVKVAPIGERGGEPQRLGEAVGGGEVGKGRHDLRGGAERVLVAARAQDRQEYRFRIGGADARAVELVRDQRLDLAPQSAPIADHAVMHEQPAPARERMAVRARDRRPGRGAHMGEIEVGMDVAAQVAQVLVRPGRPHLAIEPGFRMLAVPSEPK